MTTIHLDYSRQGVEDIFGTDGVTIIPAHTEEEEILWAMGYRMKTNTKRKIYVNDAGDVGGKECSHCGVFKMIDDFTGSTVNEHGKIPTSCLKCCAERTRMRRMDPEVRRQQSRYARERYWNDEEFRKDMLKRSSEWGRKSGQYRLNGVRREARIRKLPNSFTPTDHVSVMNHFGGCFITGSSDVHLDHFTPVSAKYVDDSDAIGTVPSNMIPLDATLNISKNNRNAFEWFIDRFVDGDFDDEHKERFAEGVRYLSERTTMSPREYVINHFICVNGSGEGAAETADWFGL